MMLYNSQKPEYNTRCLCKITNTSIYTILVYIPFLADNSKTWFNEIIATYYDDSFVESWYPLDSILEKTE